MAIDFFNFALLLVSFVINLLALGAFWVTPGLRTNANRFTINLLIINLIGCVILAPTLFLASLQFSRSFDDVPNDSIDFYSQSGAEQMTVRHNGRLVESEGVILNTSGSDISRTIETLYKCDGILCNELTIDKNQNKLIITKTEQAQDDFDKNPSVAMPEQEFGQSRRSWCIDLTAALGALAVLLVVGDTWCAVTDPLRYHSRMSGVKAWLLIALTWSLGILFGALSALRELNFESDSNAMELSKTKRFVASFVTSYYNISSPQNIFGLVFACLYFVIIILLPFAFVCGMYWRIFSEARENGLRMRQNGSSPLLQSSLNLMHQHHTNSLPFTPGMGVHRCSISSASSQGTDAAHSVVGGGLQMQIDRLNSGGLRRDSTVRILLPPISDDSNSEESDSMLDHPNNMDGNQNILFTLESASGEIKRNYSARQLAIMDNPSSAQPSEAEVGQVEVAEPTMRQIHSSPNLQKYTQLSQDSLAEHHSAVESTPQLLGPKHIVHHKLSISSQHSQVLQIPSHHSSHKALGYMSSIRHRLSNASSLFKYREESRAARISILVVIMFLVSYLPFGFLVLLQSHLKAANFEESNQVAIFMLLLANISSPFIFAYRNKRVRRGVKRLFGLEAKSSVPNSKHSSPAGDRKNALLRRCASSNGSYYGKYNQAQMASLKGAALQQSCSLPLRSNNSCSSIIQCAKNSVDIVGLECAKVNGTSQLSNQWKQQQQSKPQQLQLPMLQGGVTLVEQIPTLASKLVSSKHSRQHSFFKWFFRKSKELQAMNVQAGVTEVKAAVIPADV